MAAWQNNIMLYELHILASKRGRQPLFKYTYAGAGAVRREHNRAFQFDSDLWPDAFKQLTQRSKTDQKLFSDFSIWKDFYVMGIGLMLELKIYMLYYVRDT